MTPNMVTRQNTKKRVYSSYSLNEPTKENKNRARHSPEVVMTATKALYNPAGARTGSYLSNLDLWPNKKKDNKSRSVR